MDKFRKSSFFLPLLAVFSLSILLYFTLNLTNPLTAGPAGVLLVFILIYCLSLACLVLLLKLGEFVFAMTSTQPRNAVMTDKIASFRHKGFLISTALALVPIFIISLNSIGNLEIKDIILIFIIEAILIFYIVRRAAK